MFGKSWKILSLGERYFLVSIMYVGLGLLVSNALPATVVVAQSAGCNGENGCPTGMQCCDGTCISSSSACCDDGTVATSPNCACCSPTEGAPTTAVCNSGD